MIDSATTITPIPYPGTEAKISDRDSYGKCNLPAAAASRHGLARGGSASKDQHLPALRWDITSTKERSS